ncbi:protein arginine N-methyltransferase 1 [Fusarium oxysporum f. sp. lycopersici 4287]|uniref:Protein arginine N-methyltransferase 1 n=1 Tax=Fusarium oxysporum f. sp. lycopersici (strain 4287 / CBS 123668 / FGSC 9935 / NRRL 34936) TaxID=426428 RepID=A0A0J9WB60_FUSO4|nr:protein arginine N-methyltransferase 1 [Fusarium oxysporum f. sp. lycopersici 4287]KNB20614.1 protein arginine N-methyltransferase 1 [Fusarium oxysporum f. sp. lycopersici 4287]
MTSIKTIIFLLLSGSRAATINSRDYRPDEHLMLVDCGVGADGTAKSNVMAYYAGSYNPGGGDTKWVQPDMIANVPWDGSYPWRSSGVATTFSNGDTFQVAINPAIKDWEESKSYAGDAKHTFGNEFKCWAEHGKPAFDLPDGTACTSAYICFHQPDNPPPAPATDFQVVTDYGMSKEEIQVRVQGTNSEVADWTPEAAFSHINEDDEGLQCKGTSYSIGNDCSITFDDCFFSARENVPSMKKTLIEAVAPAVAKTSVTKTGRYSGSCRNEGMCEPDYEFEYLEYTYPVTGTVLEEAKDRQGLFYFEDVLTVQQGEQIALNLDVRPNSKNTRDLDIKISYELETEDANRASKGALEYRIKWFKKVVRYLE